MPEKSDAELLREYADRGNEAAFREIVHRHADLVYASALRQVRSPELARDIAQNVFSDLARKSRSLAGTLTGNASLLGWLYRSTCFEALTQLRDDRRRHARERQAMQELDTTSETEWERIGPVLDEAMADLSDEDREAILLRFFKNLDFRAIGVTLGVSDDAAQKRVSRALERLRAGLASRGVTTTAVALASAISANVVSGVPAGLAAALSTAALSGTTVTTAATATQAIAMTTLQKTLIAATVVAAVGVGIYEARQASTLRKQVQTLQQKQAPLVGQIEQLSKDRDAVMQQLAALRDENERLNRNTGELLRLRGQIGLLKVQLETAKNTESKSEQPPLATARDYYNKADRDKNKRDYEAALEDLNKAIELDPNMAEAYVARADLYALHLPKERGGSERAVVDYARCLEIDPKNWIARWSRASEFRKLMRYDEAIADWTFIIEGDLDFTRSVEGKTKSIAQAYVWRGDIYQSNKKDYARAIADYSAALQLDPNNGDAHRLRGACYEKLGEREKAQKDAAIEPKDN